MENNSQIVFVLHGLNQSLLNRRFSFGLALTAYLFTLFVNLTLIGTVLLEKTHLHQSMYFFLCNLCMNGICGASSFYPKLLHDLLADAPVVSYAGCLAQMFVGYSYIFCEFTSLTVMAYDRYVAICWPLRYRELMTLQKVALLLLLTWTFSLLETAVGLALVLQLQMCGHHISKMFCTNWELVKLACPPASYNDAYSFLITALHLSQAALIVVSYAQLIRSATSSRSDRRKFLQTCVPHLTALLVFAGSLLFDGAACPEPHHLRHEPEGGPLQDPLQVHQQTQTHHVKEPSKRPLSSNASYIPLIDVNAGVHKPHRSADQSGNV